ncbi:MAG: penicillin-binding transpeptidase domain-containing protein [Patescibacteria group bacterium]|nr:penicillin-binding transpeptidase domain-containing protein [Patescibacteria group bacterium]
MRRKKVKNVEVSPDEIFLDSRDLPDFNKQQFEGRLEKPIPKKTVNFLGIFFAIIGLIFICQLFILQIVKGEAYLIRSESNTLDQEPVFSDRGLIYDRNQELLVWNSWEDNNRLNSPTRTYISDSGFAHLLGYVSSPAQDKKGNYWQDIFIGKDGIEKEYDYLLKGQNGVKIKETDVKGEIQAENIVTPPVAGENLLLSIDKRIQNELYRLIANMAQTADFVGGAGIIMDVSNGELLALTNYPEYNSNILSKGKDSDKIGTYLTDQRKFFLNRAVSGLYTPGSIVKPFLGYAALNEDVISPSKLILSNGSISIPNPYYPELKSVFKDHGIFGWVDMREAIAVSSDVYFYEIGGGFEDQKGLGIRKIGDYMKEFGLAQKTGIDLGMEGIGIVPSPEWKEEIFDGDIWRVGDTYNTSIGQYGFQVTLVQMARATAGIANDGIIPTPHLLLNDKKEKIILDIDEEKMKVVKEGMREAVTDGTAIALYLPQVKVAAKTGTAQVGRGNTNVNSWIIGFFPYENPKYSFAVLMERGPKDASGNATRVMRNLIKYIHLNIPEYLDNL